MIQIIIFHCARSTGAGDFLSYEDDDGRQDPNAAADLDWRILKEIVGEAARDEKEMNELLEFFQDYDKDTH